MKVEELRIGNLVVVENKEYRPKDSGIPTRVTEIGRSSKGAVIGVEVNNDDFGQFIHFIHFINPIPLTEEWLLKFGFIKVEREAGGFKYGICIGGVHYLECHDLSDNGFLCNKCMISMDHVHQLQNLYFALTGEELQIKA
jgi:hypothetical protein